MRALQCSRSAAAVLSAYQAKMKTPTKYILKLYIWLEHGTLQSISTCTPEKRERIAATAASLNRHHYLRWRRICGICSELLSLLLRQLRRRLREEEPSPVVLVLESWMQGGIPTVLAFSSKIVKLLKVDRKVIHS